jgi:hypothetical protein
MTGLLTQIQDNLNNFNQNHGEKLVKLFFKKSLGKRCFV